MHTIHLYMYVGVLRIVDVLCNVYRWTSVYDDDSESRGRLSLASSRAGSLASSASSLPKKRSKSQSAADGNRKAMFSIGALPDDVPTLQVPIRNTLSALHVTVPQAEPNHTIRRRAE